MVKRAVKVTPSILAQMIKGDKRCALKIGERVIKTVKEEGDLHDVGTKGYITGSIHHEGLGSAYLVKFDRAKHAVLCLERKLAKDV